MPFKLQNDNTRVLKPIIFQTLKRKLIRREKNELIGPDTRPQIIREQAQAKSNQMYNKQRMDKAQAQTLQAMLTPFVIADPSHIAGVITSDKPIIETIGDPGILATSNELANFLVSSITPSSFIKAMALPAIRMSASQLLYKISKGQLTKELLIKQGATLAEANWLFKELPLLKVGKGNQNKMNAILDKVANGLKGKKGANELILAAAKFDDLTPAGRLENIRTKYKEGVEAVNAASKKGQLQLNWWDNTGINHLAKMPDELKISTVGFNVNPFLDRYLSNVINKIGPKLKELLDKGLLRPTKDGKHWEGLVADGTYELVDPYRYIISHLDRAQAYGNYVNPYPTSVARIPRHGTRVKDYKYLTKPSTSFNKTLFSVIDDRSVGAKKGIDWYEGKGASIPLLTKPHLEPRRMKGRAGNSNIEVSSGALPGTVAMPRGVSDPLVGGASMNEYNFGPNVDNIKSYWNTLDFDYGAGPLAMINSKLDKLLA